MSRPVIITAGGTGGHMFPALALEAELKRRGQAVALVCDRRGARYLSTDVESHVIRAASPSGSLVQRLKGLAELAVGFGQSVALIRRLRPTAVAAFGGYAAVPVALAAQLLKVPVLVHEQNAVLGKANRLIARRAAQLALSFAETAATGTVAAERRLVTGNPVRDEVAALQAEAYAPLGEAERLRVLVVGGSQGARVLSDVLPAAIALLDDAARARIELTQQCRPEDLERVGAAYAEIDFAAELQTFFDDLPERMAAAHLIVSRSGASSVAEILALGRPALFVPYRFAMDDHQRANAEASVAAGAAWVIGEAELTPERVAAKLKSCLDRPDLLVDMTQRARGLGRRDAASALADALSALIARSPANLPLEALA